MFDDDNFRESNRAMSGLQTFETGVPAKQTPQIQRSIDDLDRNLNVLGHTLDELFAKIEPVLAPDNPRPASGEVRTPREASAIAQKVYGLSDRVDQITQAVSEFIARTEL